MNRRSSTLIPKGFFVKGMLSLIWSALYLISLTGCDVVPESVEINQAAETGIPETSTIEPSLTSLPDTPTPDPTNTPYPTSAPQDPTITVCNTGCDYLTLQAAIDNPGTIDGYVIRIMDEIHTEAGILVSKSVTIQGMSEERSIIQAHEQAEMATDRVFLVAEGVTVIIRDLIIQKGYPT